MKKPKENLIRFLVSYPGNYQHEQNSGESIFVIFVSGFALDFRCCE